MKTLLKGTVITRMVLSAILLTVQPDVALSHDASDGEPPLFTIGDSCAALAYVEPEQLAALVRPSRRVEFDAFCFPEEPFFCSDYTALVARHGSMEVGPDGHMCRFVPHHAE